MNCLVISQDESDTEIINQYIRLYDHIIVTGKFNDVNAALPTIHTQAAHLDLIVVEAIEPNLAAIQTLLVEGKNLPLLIFLAFDPSYAATAFDVCAFDYLVKPYSLTQLQKTLLRARDFLDMKEKAQQYDICYQSDVLIIKEGS